MQETSDYVKGVDRQAEEKTLAEAREILRRRICKKSDLIPSSTQEVAEYICLRVGGLEHEAFGVMFLDLRGELIAVEEMFRGTLQMVGTHTREIAKAVLAHNAAAIVVYHNHPTADPTPSAPDIHMTRKLAEAMDMIGVKLVDHIVVAGEKWTSLAQQQLMRKRRMPPELRGLPPDIQEALIQMLGGEMGIDT